MDKFYRNWGGNAGRGANPLARQAAMLVEETRVLASSWLDAHEVVFSPSATIALNVVLTGASLRPGDVVYLTPFEHNSVLRPVEHLRQRMGIEVRLIPFNRQSLQCDLEKTHSLFQVEPPTLLCITQTSNVLGVLLPVDDLIAIAREDNREVITIVDGSQGAGLYPLQMSGIDALIFSGHKSLYGPYGASGIAFGRDWRPEPLIYGGTGTQSESLDMPTSGSSRYEAGSQNILALAGLNAALKWLIKQGCENLSMHIRSLTYELQETLRDIPSINVFAPSDNNSQVGIVSFTVGTVSPQAIEMALGAEGIAVRAGLHCAPWLHHFIATLEQGGTVRASIGYFNSADDVKNLGASLAKIVKNLVN